MNRRIAASRPLRGQREDILERFRHDPAEWLPPLTQPAGQRGHWRVYLWGGEIGVLVHLALGEPAHAGGATWRRLRWDADDWWGARRVPAFDGDLGVREDGEEAILLLQGTYDPPGGLFGLLADRILLRRLAAATLHQFLADVAQRLDPAPSAPSDTPSPPRSLIPPD